jgi:SAM-dependent methyltransferase
MQQEDTTGSAHTAYDAHYASGGFDYDKDREKYDSWLQRNYIEEFGLEPDWKLLDAGCGNGFWSQLFAESGLRVTGIDISEGGIRAAQERAPALTFLTGNVEDQLPFSPGEFDVVFVRNISHLCEASLDRPATLAAMRRLLSVVRQTGLMLVSQYSHLDGTTEGAVTYHPLSDYVRLFEQVGDIFKLIVVRQHVIMGIRPAAPPA